MGLRRSAGLRRLRHPGADRSGGRVRQGPGSLSADDRRGRRRRGQGDTGGGSLRGGDDDPGQHPRRARGSLGALVHNPAITESLEPPPASTRAPTTHQTARSRPAARTAVHPMGVLQTPIMPPGAQRSPRSTASIPAPAAADCVAAGRAPRRNRPHRPIHSAGAAAAGWRRGTRRLTAPSATAAGWAPSCRVVAVSSAVDSAAAAESVRDVAVAPSRARGELPQSDRACRRRPATAAALHRRCVLVDRALRGQPRPSTPPGR